MPTMPPIGPTLHRIPQKSQRRADNYAMIERNMDSTHYYTIVRWEGKASFAASGKNSFTAYAARRRNRPCGRIYPDFGKG